MKVILNADVKYLGEEGDVKIVANGYARNYLYPRNLALPYNETTVAYFESRKEEIEAKKAQKRADAASLKEKISALNIVITMPAGNNGKLYGAVTAMTISEALAKEGFEIERKRIEIAGATIKTIGKYVVKVHLYESAVAELSVEIASQDGKVEEKRAEPKAEKAAEAEPAAEEAKAE